MTKIITIIPARMGSQRLEKKNLHKLTNRPLLITRAIRTCRDASIFDEIWVHSEHTAFAEIAPDESVKFHQRLEALSNNQTTSEQYIAEFLEHHSCHFVVQFHSIAPLLAVEEIRSFVLALENNEVDCLLSRDLQIAKALLPLVDGCKV